MIVCGLAGAVSIYSIVLGLASLLFLFLKKEIFIVIYLITVGSNGLISRGDYIYGIVGPIQIVSILALVYFLSSTVLDSSRSSSSPLKEFKIISNLIIFLFIYSVGDNITDYYFGIKGDFNDLIKVLVNASTKFGSLWIILIKNGEKYYNAIFNSIFSIIIFYGITLILSPILLEIGYRSDIEEQILYSFVRYDGFMGSADSNSISSIFALLLGFVFSISEKIRIKRTYIFISIIIATMVIALTVSRTGLLLYGFVLLFYAIRNISISKIYIIAISLVILPVIFQNSLTRFDKSVKGQASAFLGNRGSKWIYYIDFLSEEPMSFIRGSSREIIMPVGYYRAAHNLYVQIIYENGIIVLLFFIFQLYGVYKYRKKTYMNVYYILIPLMANIFTVSDSGSILYFIMAYSIFISIGMNSTNQYN